MVLFGHSAKKRGRPLVVEAIQTTVKAITGREARDPAAFDALLQEKDVKAQIQRGRR